MEFPFFLLAVSETPAPLALAVSLVEVFRNSTQSFQANFGIKRGMEVLVARV
jgi:hypothetical protein